MEHKFPAFLVDAALSVYRRSVGVRGRTLPREGEHDPVLAERAIDLHIEVRTIRRSRQRIRNGDRDLIDVAGESVHRPYRRRDIAGCVPSIHTVTEN
jgi:hypothetical protein